MVDLSKYRKRPPGQKDPLEQLGEDLAIAALDGVDKKPVAVKKLVAAIAQMREKDETAVILSWEDDYREIYDAQLEALEKLIRARLEKGQLAIDAPALGVMLHYPQEGDGVAEHNAMLIETALAQIAKNKSPEAEKARELGKLISKVEIDTITAEINTARNEYRNKVQKEYQVLCEQLPDQLAAIRGGTITSETPAQLFHALKILYAAKKCGIKEAAAQFQEIQDLLPQLQQTIESKGDTIPPGVRVLVRRMARQAQEDKEEGKDGKGDVAVKVDHARWLLSNLIMEKREQLQREQAKWQR